MYSPSTFKRSILVMIAGLVIFIVYLYFYIGIHQITRVLVHLNSVQFAIFYALALLAVLAGVFFWSTAWNTILRTLSVNISYRTAYSFYWIGIFVDLIFPCATICGELTRLFLVQNETKRNYGLVAASAITNRITAYTIIAGGLYTGTVLIFLKGDLPLLISNLFLLFVVAVSIYLGVLLYLAFVEGGARQITNAYLKIKKAVLRKRYNPVNEQEMQEGLENYYSGFRLFRERPSLLIKPILFQLCSYLLGLLVYVFIFLAVGLPVYNVQFFIVVYFIAQAVQDAIASFSVGSLGIILSTIFVFYGFNPGISGITAVMIRSAGFWFPLLISFLAIQLYGARNILKKVPIKSRNIATDFAKLSY